MISRTYPECISDTLNALRQKGIKQSSIKNEDIMKCARQLLEYNLEWLGFIQVSG